MMPSTTIGVASSLSTARQLDRPSRLKLPDVGRVDLLQR